MDETDLVGIHYITRVLLVYTCQQGMYPRGHVLPLRLPLSWSVLLIHVLDWRSLRSAMEPTRGRRDISQEKEDEIKSHPWLTLKSNTQLWVPRSLVLLIQVFCRKTKLLDATALDLYARNACIFCRGKLSRLSVIMPHIINTHVSYILAHDGCVSGAQADGNRVRRLPGSAKNLCN
jgi:hypothetical protein